MKYKIPFECLETAGHYYTKVLLNTLDGKCESVWFIIDTGADHSCICRNTLDAIGFIPIIDKSSAYCESSEFTRGLRLWGKEPSTDYRRITEENCPVLEFPKVTFGDYVLEDFRFTLISTEGKDSHVNLLGTDLLGLFHMYFRFNDSPTPSQIDDYGFRKGNMLELELRTGKDDLFTDFSQYKNDSNKNGFEFFTRMNKFGK